ncbi:AbrB/MazE/SpoVT family DNA-binding domain-containing protein [Candidatus Woesearchaeota archaeon]|nr:AbrB/MazE/SpoVT family DNA-binding domain-containing protein [Candidatus Woesearchaeota archaeon]
MTDISVTSVSSKGQVVIPVELRGDLREGDRLIVIRNKEQIILKKASAFRKHLAEDLAFARRTEEAWKEYDKGRFKSMSADEFLGELKKA